jgi:formate/nitrite transporter FocA (FNT family)
MTTALLVSPAGRWSLGGDEDGASALFTANAEVSIPFGEAVARGNLRNALINNVAAWLCFSARSNVDQIFAIIAPITACATSGFEPGSSTFDSV